MGTNDSYFSEFFQKKIKADFKTIEFTNAFDVLYYDVFALQHNLNYGQKIF